MQFCELIQTSSLNYFGADVIFARSKQTGCIN